MGDAILRIPRDARVRAYRTRDTYDGVVPAASFVFGARIWLRMTFNYPVLWVRVKGQG